MDEFLRRLQDRKLVQWALAYLAAAFALIQVLDIVIQRFGGSESIARLLIVALALGFFVTLVLAWYHGEKGAQRVSGIELLILALLLVIGGGALWRFGPKSEGESSDVARNAEHASAPIPAKSIAVLPFENLSRDPDNAYFADGMQDEILTRLAGIGDLKVISRTSTKHYASKPENLKVVAGELGVANILEGSVQKAGDSVRINVQLIDAHSDTHLWAQTFDRELKNVFTVESEVAQQIAEVLKAQLSPQETKALDKAPTKNAAAYDQFLRAEAEARRAGDTQSEEDFRGAKEDYRKTIALDPDFGLAYAQLAVSQLQLGWYVKPLTEAQLAEVKAAVDRALALAPDLPQAHVALGFFHYWGHRDYDPALREFERALQLAPSQADALAGIAFIHRRKGEWPQAVTAFEKALALAPRDANIADNFGETLTIVRRFADAEPALLLAVALDPARISAVSYLVRNRLFGFGDVDGARRAVNAMPAGTGRMLAHDHGDVTQLTGALVYPDLFERRFDDALRAWDTISANTPAQRIERLSARAAIMTVAHRQNEIRGECTELETLLEAPGTHRPDDDRWLTRLAWAQLCLECKPEAIRTAHQAAQALPFERDALAGADQLAGLAEIDAQAGAPDEAIELIGRLLALPAGLTTTVERLKRDPVYDPLRGDARFKKLIAGGDKVFVEGEPKP